MTDSTSTTTPSRFPTFQAFRQFFGWKFWRRCLIGLATLATLLGLFYGEERVRGRRAWEKYRAEQEAAGVRFDLKALVPPEVPDDQNFAMTPLLAPLYDFLPGTQKCRDTNGQSRAQNFAKDLRVDNANLTNWRKGERTDLAKWLAEFQQKPGPGWTNATGMNQLSRGQQAAAALDALKEFEPVLDEIRSASRRPHARFNVRYDWENPAAILLPHLIVIKRLCQVLTLRAGAELAAGRADQAFADLQLVLYLADAIKDEPIVITQLVRLACYQSAFQVLWEGLADRQWSEAQIRECQAKLQGINLLADNLRALDVGERAGMGHGIFEYLRKDPAQLQNLGGSESPGDFQAGSIFRVLPTGWLYFEEISYHKLFVSYALQGVDAGTMRVQPRLIEDNGTRLNALLTGHPFKMITQHRVLSTMLLPALVNIHKKAAAGQCAVDEAIIACALERYRLKNGGFPDTLDALSPEFLAKIPHDLIGGQPLKYQRAGDGQFVLYAVGWNEKDDGGSTGLDKNNKVDLDHGDWVWRYPAR